LGEIDDSVMVARLLIAGAHDAATGEGFFDSLADTYATTQDVGLRMQFESGIRAFDLRPVMHGDTMQVAHALFDTRVSFGQSLDIIISEIDAHPTEFAIILMRNESDTERGNGSWASLMERELSRVGDRFAEFSDTIRVGQLRGKILLLSRDKYDGHQYGANIVDWPDMPTMAECRWQGANGSGTLLVQDYYETVGSRQQTKNDAIEALLRLSSVINGAGKTPVWIANYASGYAATTAEGYSLSSGYRQNAASTSAFIRQFLASGSIQNRPAGIVFMDFAGVDLSENYAVGGLSLTRQIIKVNL